MYQDLQQLFDKLKKSKFRSQFRLKGDDRLYAECRTKEILGGQALDIIQKRLSPENPSNDGKQTPMRGHPVFVAQHATGCCCRSCLSKWHGIPQKKKLSEKEEQYIVSVILAWIQRDLQKPAPIVKLKKGETGFLL